MRIPAVVSVVFAGCLALTSQPAHATPLSVERSLRAAAEVVDYACTTTGDAAETQDVKISVELTMPDDPTAGRQMSIGWHGTYVTGSELRAPTEGLADVKVYAYAAFTGIDNLTSATGVSEPVTVAAGQVVPLPQGGITLKTTSPTAGTARVRPAAVNIGPSPTAPLIQCEVRSPGTLTTYPLTVAQEGQPSPTPSPDGAVAGPKPTRTVTVTVTAGDPAGDTAGETAGDTAGSSGDDDPEQDADAAQELNATPVGGAATGGGGEAGPDGRMYALAGFVITLAACAGLLSRRRLRSR
ncbi:hypothetical protein AB0C14_27155 [Microbispora hainanensis]|uniref:hypothetical protein n=1 Tax=Microbispora hainanensis TaxID=568844 RepID=UPI0034003A0C